MPFWVELAGVLVGLLALIGFAVLIMRPPDWARWSESSFSTRLTRGDFAALHISIEASGQLTWLWAVEAATGERRSAEAKLIWPIDTRYRGKQLVGPTRLEFADPFGFRHKVLADRQPTPVLIVPRIVPVPVLHTAAHLSENLMGERNGSETLHSIREYVIGDSMRLVHWRSSAHAGKLMVRRMVDTTVPALLVVLDTATTSYVRTTSMFHDFDPESFEDAVDLTASWAWANCANDQRVLITTTSARDPVIEATLTTRSTMLDWLALVKPEPAAMPDRVGILAQKHGACRIVFVTGEHSRVPAITQQLSIQVTLIRTSSPTILPERKTRGDYMQRGRKP